MITRTLVALAFLAAIAGGAVLSSQAVSACPYQQTHSS